MKSFTLQLPTLAQISEATLQSKTLKILVTFHKSVWQHENNVYALLIHRPMGKVYNISKHAFSKIWRASPPSKIYQILVTL